MHRLAVADVLGLQDTPTIGGDLVLLPHVYPPNMSEGLALQKFGVVNIETSLVAQNKLRWAQADDENRYNEERWHTGREPEWVLELPLKRQAWLRWSYATRELDPLAIVGVLPNTGLSYMVTDEGLCEAVAGTLGLLRLQHVNQLGFLQAPWVAMGDQQFVTPLTNGTRWVHSLDVACVGSVICHNLHLPKRKLNTARAAFLSHDRGTPAGGDSVKLIDPSAFDEDANYRRLLRQKTNRRKWRDVKRAFNIDERLLIRTILNQGLLGQILDVADKISYVARDIETCLRVHVAEKDADVYVGMRLLRELLMEFPTICGIWDCVRQEDEQLVFSDARRLIAFLKARIVLFRELYYHPRARFGEYLVSRVLVKRLYEEGKLTRDELLMMGDRELEQRLNETYGELNVLRALSLKSKVASFETLGEAVAFRHGLEEGGNPFSLTENHLHAIKPGTHFWVDGPRGPEPLSEAYPGDAAELWEMANMLPAVHVYYPVEKEEAGKGGMAEFLRSMRQTA